MKPLKDKIASIPWGRLSFVFLLIASGVLLLVFPEHSLTWSVRIIAGVILVLAFSQLIITLCKKARGLILFLELAVTAIAGTAAGFMLYTPEHAFEYLVICTGVGLMIDGAFKLQPLIHSRLVRSPLWWIVLVLSFGAIAGGFSLIRFPITEDNVRLITILIGCFLLLDGVQNLIAVFFRPILFCPTAPSDKLLLTEVRAEEEATALPAPALDAPAKTDAEALPPSDAAEKLSGVSE